MTQVKQWVRDIVGEGRLYIGLKCFYKGKPVKIIGGQFWGEYGVSNFWDFRYLENEKLGCDYDNGPFTLKGLKG